MHNVLLTAGMGGFVAKLADFGTALRIPTNQLLTESVGTSGYTAPEVISGGYDLSADIFSLGILQWETLQPYDQKKENPLCGRPEEDVAEDVRRLGHYVMLSYSDLSYVVCDRYIMVCALPWTIA